MVDLADGADVDDETDGADGAVEDEVVDEADNAEAAREAEDRLVVVDQRTGTSTRPAAVITFDSPVSAQEPNLDDACQNAVLRVIALRERASHTEESTVSTAPLQNILTDLEEFSGFNVPERPSGSTASERSIREFNVAGRESRQVTDAICSKP